MANPWISFVKQYALENNISYKKALQEAKQTYRNPKKAKYEKQLDRHNEEEAQFERDVAKETKKTTKKVEDAWGKHTDLYEISQQSKGVFQKKVQEIADRYGDYVHTYLKKNRFTHSEEEALMSGQKVRGIILPEGNDELFSSYGLDEDGRPHMGLKDWIAREKRELDSFGF
jgi:membrane-bound lytic murein transglycosylase